MSQEKREEESPNATGEATQLFSKEERAAMREYAKELKAAARANRTRAEGESDVLAKIGEMTGSDKEMATRIHEIVKTHAPDLSPKTWYGMPAYAKDGAVICFFQSAAKFNARYATLGFNGGANIDEGVMWPVAFALTEITAAEEERIVELVKKAAS